MNFKPGDKVRVKPCWNNYKAEEKRGKVYTVEYINPDFVYMGVGVVKVDLGVIWAEPHELELVSKLQKVLE